MHTDDIGCFADLLSDSRASGGVGCGIVHEQEGRIIISVDNDGIQIPEDDLLRLWEPFYRVDKAHNRSDGGSGLGLAIVHAAVLAHGGICEVKNRPGGVCFRVILPQVSNK